MRVKIMQPLLYHRHAVRGALQATEYDMMLTGNPRPTAEIIPFPIRGRILDAQAERRSPALDVAALDRPRVSYDSWYHDEAIRDSQFVGKR